MFYTSPTKEHVVICCKRVIEWDVRNVGPQANSDLEKLGGSFETRTAICCRLYQKHVQDVAPTPEHNDSSAAKKLAEETICLFNSSDSGGSCCHCLHWGCSIYERTSLQVPFEFADVCT